MAHLVLPSPFRAKQPRVGPETPGLDVGAQSNAKPAVLRSNRRHALPGIRLQPRRLKR